MINYSMKGINETWKIECIARNELLTKDVLIRELTKSSDLFLINIYKRKIFNHMRKIMREYKLTEQEVVYLFLRLYFFGAVKNFDFSKAFNDCTGLLLKLWLSRYYALVDKYQQEKIIV